VTEADRIKAEYERRERQIPRQFYAFDRAPNLFFLHGRERELRDLLDRQHLLPLTDCSLLEIGCGTGEWFATFQRLGLRRDRLAGIDLDGPRVEEARVVAPEADLRAGDASALPWPDASFDLVFQSTVFSSILDEGMQRAVAAEMKRVLKPGGALLWYDFSFDNPGNRAVRGIRASKLRELFPGFEVESRKVTLAPPLARRLVPLSWTVSSLLESLRLLNTHVLAILRAR
jgi:ubiquinone/menaquinone biosynthesis C-methylase UbiE